MLQFGLPGFEMTEDGLARLPERAVHVEISLLGEIPDSDFLWGCHRSRRGFILPNQDAQQRGLADTIGADQRHARTLRDGEADAAEEVEIAEGFGERGGCDERHGC